MCCVGRTNTACCCCSTSLVFHFVGLLSISLLACTCINFYRIMSNDLHIMPGSPMIAQLVIDFTRALFYLTTTRCCSKRDVQREARVIYLVLLAITSMAEILMLGFQLKLLLDRHTLGMGGSCWLVNRHVSCNLITTVGLAVNWVFALFYLYFISVAYEYYRFSKVDDPKDYRLSKQKIRISGENVDPSNLLAMSDYSSRNDF